MKKSIALVHLLGIFVFATEARAQPAGAFVWVDSNGDLVGWQSVSLSGEGFLTSSDYPPYIDDGGFIWRLDTERGELSDFGLAIRYFLEPSCAGTPYIPAGGIRQVFRVASTPGRWVRSDNEQAHMMRFASDDTGVTCEPINPYTTDHVVVPLSTLRPAPDDPPVLPFTPPFHIEKR